MKEHQLFLNYPMQLCQIHLDYAWLVHEGKDVTGCLPSLVHPMTGTLLYQPDCPMCEDSKNSEPAGSSTTNVWSPIPRKLDYQDCVPTLETAMPSSPSPMPHVTMCGKKTPEFPERSSSLELSPFAGIQKLIGMPSETLLSREVWMMYHPTYSFVVTINSEELAKTIYDQLLWSVPVMCFGVELELVNRVAPGKKPVWMLILKVSWIHVNFTLDPNSKFWDGYQGQDFVVIDEFRGSISISHLLRWLDRYPVIVEVKGSSVCFRASRVWITSNLDPKAWYPDADKETVDALMRRLTVVHFQ